MTTGVTGAEPAPADDSNAFTVSETRREDTRFRSMIEGDITVIDIRSDSGIDRATLTRRAQQWPKSMVVRLHLRGLESFKASAGKVTVEWSVSSSTGRAVAVSLRTTTGETMLDAKSPCFSKISIVGGTGKLPLRNGHFDVPLPPGLFRDNPASLTLSWVDFFRN
jgi:hypothetical protein